MSHNRFYVDATLEGTITITGDEHHHLFRVMRNQEGDTVTLVNGRGSSAEAVISTLTKKEARLDTTSSITEKPQEKTTTLIQALPKKHNLELIIEKTCELGVDHIILFKAENSPKFNTNTTRLNQLLISSMKQCDRLFLPTLQIVDSLQDVPKQDLVYFIGTLDTSAPTLKPAQKNTAIFIGPESGLTENEISYITSHFNACGIRLSRNTLRTETAAIAAITLLNAYL